MPPTENRDLNRFIIRMPEGMRDWIAEEAEKNHRSMNAEIVARLEESRNLRDSINGRMDSNPPPSKENTLYIVLDTDGMPISWAEISTHISNITKAGKLPWHSQKIMVMTPELMSSTLREDNDYELLVKYAKFLRDLRKKPKSSEPDAPKSDKKSGRILDL